MTPITMLECFGNLDFVCSATVSSPGVVSERIKATDGKGSGTVD